MKILRVWLPATMAALAAFSAPSRAEEILVSSAVSFAPALREAAGEFERLHPGLRVTVNAGASGLLLQQVLRGAPVDLLISASPEEIVRLEQEGRAEPGTRRGLASNRLVVVVPAGADPPPSFADLRASRFDRIAIGDPATVPAGRYAEQALRSLGLLEPLRPRLLPAGDVRQVLAHVARGEVPAGIVYATDAALRPESVRAGPEAPPGSHDPILYEGIVPAGARGRETAARFLEFLRSPAGRRALAARGFLPPPE